MTGLLRPSSKEFARPASRLHLADGKSVHLSLDERIGSGFVSQDLYQHGIFSASIKLPADYTSGVVAFYASSFCFSI
ncbi:hypothetical protein DVH24_036307 [Malus domestica]|uniref:GH16 domain-containing protein n=1 Tax=Malus domestica TaxID=3750 RepID=A0A498IF29_MALDO|nr:hypothetical protein DVH24_036307 [Malus domestica]